MIFKIVHFWYCVKTLGLFRGFKYWNLTIRAMGDPTFVTQWANTIRIAANKDDVMKRHTSADALREFADEIESFNLIYHKKQS